MRYTKIDLETDFASHSDYDDFANEIQFVGDILQPIHFEPIFTAAEIQAKKTWLVRVFNVHIQSKLSQA